MKATSAPRQKKQGKSCRACSGARLRLPPTAAASVVVFLVFDVVATRAAAASVQYQQQDFLANEEEYGTSHLLRKRHELSPLAARHSRWGTAAPSRDDDDDDDAGNLRVVRAMQWAAEDSDDPPRRRGMRLIAGSCAAAPEGGPVLIAALEACSVPRGANVGGTARSECCAAMRSAVGPSANVLPDCLCVPGLMDELARQAKTRAGVDIGAVLRGCNSNAPDVTGVINHAEVGDTGGRAGGSCATAARTRARREEFMKNGGDDKSNTEMKSGWEREEMTERETTYDPVENTAVAIGTTVIVDDESASFPAALTGEYPAVVDPDPRYATSSSGTGGRLIENSVFDVMAAVSNMGESLRTAAYIWTERAAREHMERQRRERATQAVFLRRMSGLLLEASYDLQLSARGGPLSTEGVAGVGTLLTAQSAKGGGGGGGGGGGSGKSDGPEPRGIISMNSSPSSSSSNWWPLWTWEAFFEEK